MKLKNVLEKTVDALSGLAFARSNSKLGQLDLAVLEVALMIAALDGKVLKSEINAFMLLAMKCRGANGASVRSAYEDALRAAGYISITVQIEDEKTVLEVFADEVVRVMPEDFLAADPSDIRRAFVIWTAMAMSDGEYSDIERKAVQLLEKRFSVIKEAEIKAKLERRAALSPAFRVAYADSDRCGKSFRLLPKGFLAAVEDRFSKTGDFDLAGLVNG